MRCRLPFPELRRLVFPRAFGFGMPVKFRSVVGSRRPEPQSKGQGRSTRSLQSNNIEFTMKRLQKPLEPCSDAPPGELSLNVPPACTGCAQKSNENPDRHPRNEKLPAE